jgi:hypothetical protein
MRAQMRFVRPERVGRGRLLSAEGESRCDRRPALPLIRLGSESLKLWGLKEWSLRYLAEGRRRSNREAAGDFKCGGRDVFRAVAGVDNPPPGPNRAHTDQVIGNAANQTKPSFKLKIAVSALLGAHRCNLNIG